MTFIWYWLGCYLYYCAMTFLLHCANPNSLNFLIEINYLCLCCFFLFPNTLSLKKKKRKEEKRILERVHNLRPHVPDIEKVILPTLSSYFSMNVKIYTTWTLHASAFYNLNLAQEPALLYFLFFSTDFKIEPLTTTNKFNVCIYIPFRSQISQLKKINIGPFFIY